MEVAYVPARWIKLVNVHEENETCRQACVIHNRTEHHMRHWPLKWRDDRGIFERVCSHGIGHPDPDQGPYWAATDQDWQWVHGCDSCCKSFCANCDDVKCMSCVVRELHGVCVEDCPSCCVDD